MKSYLKTWNFMRWLRLAIGIFIMVQGMVTRDWLFTGAGVLFLLMPLLNIGCCGTSPSCKTERLQSNKETEEPSFEEVK